MLIRFICLLLLAFISACTDKGLLKKIPADAEIAVFVDFKQLAIQSIEPGDLFELNEKGTKSSGEIWQNSGINFLSKAVIFKKSKETGDSHWFILLPLSSPEDFKKFCIQNGALPDKNNGDFLKSGSWQILIRNGMAVGVSGNQNSDINWLKKETDKLRSDTETENLLSVSSGFENLCKSEKPIGFWASAEKSFSGLDILIPADFMQGEICGSLDFKSGELNLEARMLTSDSINQEGILGTNIQKKMLERIALKSGSLGSAAINLSMPRMLKMVKSLGYSETGSIMAGHFGLSLEEIAGYLSGDVGITLSKGAELPEACIQLGIKKPADNILSKMAGGGLLNQTANHEFSIAGFEQWKVFQHDDFIEISSIGFQSSGIPDQEIQKISEGRPAQLICSLGMLDWGQSLPAGSLPVNFAGKFWKQFLLSISRENSGNNLIECRLFCREENQNSLFVLLKCLREFEAEGSQERKNTSTTDPVF